jgi:hypothetical protein
MPPDSSLADYIEEEFRVPTLIERVIQKEMGPRGVSWGGRQSRLRRMQEFVIAKW